MGTLLFGRTQDAHGTPFDNTDPDAVAENLTSQTVQAAIIEAKRDAINNDRYPIQASFNGNASGGRYLEVFPGEGSDVAPLVAPEASKIVAYTFQANAPSNAVMEIFNLTTNVVIVSAPFNNTSLIAITGVNIPGVNGGDFIGFRVGSGSVNKPKARVWFNTVT